MIQKRHNITILVLLLVGVLGSPLYGQTNWYKYPGNPVFQPGNKGDWDEELHAFDILIENNEYHMWYIGYRKNNPRKKSLGFSTSSDGIHWEKHEENPLRFRNDHIGWGNNLSTFDIVRIGSLYLMWYTTELPDTESTCIGFAWSEDGILWNNHPEPVLRPNEGDTWDGHGVGNPSIIYDGKKYHLWYTGWAKRIPKTVQTGYATSLDGINWKKHPDNPVLKIGEPGRWDDQWAVGYDVTFNGSLFEMWYFGWNLVKFEIGLATSVDGILWNKSMENPILKAGEIGTWDAIMLGPNVSIKDSAYRLWYAGNNSISVRYGYATNVLLATESQKKDYKEIQQRLIRIQVFNNVEYINVDSLTHIFSELSGTALIDVCNKLALAWSLNDEIKSYSYAGQALELANKFGYSKGKAMALYSIGNSQYVRNNYSAALTNQLMALRLFDSLNMMHEQGNLLSQIASIHTYAGSHDLAAKYYQQSLEVFTTKKDTSSILSTMNYLGEAFLEAGDTLLAKETFKKELLLARIFEQSNSEGSAYEGLGKCFQGRSLDSSIFYLEKARTIWKNNMKLNQAINSILIAETYLASGNEYCKNAEEYLQQSINLLLYSIGDGQHQLRWCYRMAELKIKTRQYSKAKEYLDLSLKMCRTFLSKHDQQQYVSLNSKLEFGVLLKEYMEKIYTMYYKLDLALKEKDRALNHYMLASAWSDSVSNDQAWKKVSMIEAQYETEKAQDHIAVLEKDNELKNLTLKKSRIYLFGLGTLVLIIILGAIIFIRSRKVKAQHTIELEKVKSDKLQELDHLKSRFFANISHEFRTPLTLIMGPLEKVLLKTKDISDKKDLNIAKKYAGRLQNLINHLLTISKLESGKMQLHASEVNIVKMVWRYLQAYESLANQKNIELKFSADVEELSVFIDKEKFEQILNNLLSNAFKFTGDGGRIEVNLIVGNNENLETSTQKLTAKNQYVQIKVSDTGFGISPEHIDHIFDRFYQAEHEDNYYEGTGIGLALSKELVELHHGIIKVKSELGKGSTFNIIIPLGKDHLKPEEIIEDQPDDIKSQTSQEVSVNIDVEEDKNFVAENMADDDTQPILLIVEDNADMLAYIRGYFDNAFRIIEAVDGLDGFEKSIEYIPDIIISDVMMPRMDGNSFCRKVKSDERTSHIPVVLLTARAAKENRIESLETGADDFITKPFDGEELKVRVDNLIHQRKKLQEHYLKNFEPIEEEILTMDEKFLQRAKTVIMKNLSNSDYSVEDFASDMALSRNQLHRKLRALINNSCSEFIRTIRLNYAADLLRKKTGSISEIAYDTGFNNPTYFSISFKQQFGISPSEYQKN